MLSVFDLIKIGIGPSSSHTVGPWIAASHFLKILKKKNQNIKSIDIFLYGSLAKTGKGHGTDVAVVMGLLNEDYKTIDPAQIMPRFNAIKDGGMITIFSQTICFDYEKNLHFQSNITLDAHPNGMKFLVLLEDDTSFEKTYFSIGGGFVVDDNQESIHSNCESEKKALYPYASEKEIFRYCKTFNCNISDFVFKNELSWRTEEQIHHQALFLWNSMQESIWRGLNAEGFLPGHLRVARRAKSLSRKLLPQSCFRDLKTLINHIRKGPKDFNTVNKWISIFALSVNEENAALGKIVTAPTNGSSGVMPAVMMYATCFLENFTPSAITKFILTAGSIGILYKINATISAAMGGCQAEIGVSSSMSAGALVEFVGGSKEQVMKAAEIAMEHHLGMTCDPIGGLVQIPCIERNIMGAVKAITAANVTIEESVEHQKIFLDDVIQTLWSTALDMSHKYKETSEGGLALIPLNIAEC